MLGVLLQMTLCELDADMEYRQIVVTQTCSAGAGSLRVFNKRISIDLAQYTGTFSVLSKAASIQFENVTFEISGSTAKLASFSLLAAEVTFSNLKNVTVFFNQASVNADEIHLFQQTFFGTVDGFTVYGNVALNCAVHATVFHKFYGNVTAFLSRLEAQSTCAYQLLANDFQKAKLSNIAVYDVLSLVGVANYQYINVRDSEVFVDMYQNAMNVRSSRSVDLSTTAVQNLHVTNYIDSFKASNVDFRITGFSLADLGAVVATSLATIDDKLFFYQGDKIFAKNAPNVVFVDSVQVIGAGTCDTCVSAQNCEQRSSVQAFWSDFQRTTVTSISCSCLNSYQGALCDIGPTKAGGSSSVAWIAVVCVLAVLVVGLAIALTIVLLQKKKGPTEIIDLSNSTVSRPQSGKRAAKASKSQIAKNNTPRTTSAQQIFQYESSSISPARFDSSVDGPRSISVIKQPKDDATASPASFNVMRKAASRSGIEKLQSEEDDASYMDEGPVVDLDKM